MFVPICLAAVAVANHHAVLISYSTSGDRSPANDCTLMAQALTRSGWKASDIKIVDGNSDQGSFAFLEQEVRLANGEPIVVFISGAATLEPRELTLSMGRFWRWDTLMRVLSRAGEVTLIPDTGFSNLAYGAIPANVRGLVVDGTWRDITQKRITTDVLHNGQRMQVGILTYIIAREWPFSTSLANLAYRVNKIKDSASMAALWAETPRVRTFGRHSLDPL